MNIFLYEEVIASTPTHPYYVEGSGYIEAQYLRAGDKLLSVNGQKVVVEWVQHELLESPITVYNFEVQEHHNYFVGDSAGVLVHNACGGKVKYTNNDLKAKGFNVKEGKTSVYVSRDAQGNINYVGITDNIHKRTMQHKYAGKGIVPEEVISGISRKDARGIEQVLIDMYGHCIKENGATNLLNKINSIARNNTAMNPFIDIGTKVFEALFRGVL